MKKILNLIRRLLLLRKEPLYLNSIFMMASTGIVSVSGFFFWIIATHFYKDAQVGLATAIISAILFIMNLSILGLNYSIIRFLPKAKNKNELITTAFLSVSVAAAFCAGAFLLFLPFFSEKLVFIRENPIVALAFFFLTIAVSIDFLTEGIFLAYRSGKYIFAKNLLVSVLKFVLPIFFIPLGAAGIFIAWALALSSAHLVSFWVLVKRFNFSPTQLMKASKLSRLVAFSCANYTVGLLGIVPEFVLPILITNTLSAQTAAYFYIAFMMANLLYTIPFATTQSLFAEGSRAEGSFFVHAKKASKLIAALLIPGILVFLFFGHLILLLFGKSYSTEGLRFLQLLAIAGIPVALNYLGLTYVNVYRKMKALIVINTLGIGSIILLSYLLRGYGLTGIGIAWLAGHVFKNLLYGSYMYILESGGGDSSTSLGMTIYLKLLNAYIASKYLVARLRSITIGLTNFKKHIYLMRGVVFENYRQTEIGSWVFVNNNTVFSTPYGITIGNYVMIGANCLFASVHHSFDNWKMPMIFQKPEIRPIVIEDDVWIGANVTVVGGVRVGRGAVIAAGAVVTKNVDPYAIIGGVPARLIRPRFDEKTIKKAQKMNLHEVVKKSKMNLWD